MPVTLLSKPKKTIKRSFVLIQYIVTIWYVKTPRMKYSRYASPPSPLWRTRAVIRFSCYGIVSKNSSAKSINASWPILFDKCCEVLHCHNTFVCSTASSKTQCSIKTIVYDFQGIFCSQWCFSAVRRNNTCRNLWGFIVKWYLLLPTLRYL